MPLPKKQPPRIQIQNVGPQVDCGRYPVKRTMGDRVELTADIFKDGHDQLRAVVRFRREGTRKWLERPLEFLGNDRWRGDFEVAELGHWQYTVEAWVDPYATFVDELDRKIAADQQDLSGELAEGAALFGDGEPDDWRAAAPALGVRERPGKTSLGAPLEVDVERERARFGAWYELFPRSWGGFKGVERVLPKLAELGFDVIYLPPIHPIGTTNRKGRNNALVASAGDPGSPWAIGGPDGGHDAIHPELGTLRDFDRLVEAAGRHGLEVALDFAIQCSPDHPWLEQHPEWFNRRPDGTLKYAENPPKRYQDIYNVNFDSDDWQGLWQALRDALLHWCRHGVRAYRVDNPHTKSVPFWEWAIGEVRAEFPETIFFAEAFTRPAMMTTLAKIGFGQSYTYFTWKNTKAELVEFLGQLLGWAQFYRPNFFVNTPDILHEYLQVGGPAAFEARLVLAATLSPSYGIYSGFEQLRERARARGQRGVPRLGEVRGEAPEARRAAAAARAAAERAAAGGAGAPAVREPAAARDTRRPRLRLREGRCRGGGQPRSVPAAGGRRRRAAGARVSGRVPRARSLSGERYRWRVGRNYVGLAPGGSHLMKLGA